MKLSINPLLNILDTSVHFTGVEIAKGYLGVNLPPTDRVFPCLAENRKNGKVCLEWMHRARLYLSYKEEQEKDTLFRLGQQFITYNFWSRLSFKQSWVRAIVLNCFNIFSNKCFQVLYIHLGESIRRHSVDGLLRKRRTTRPLVWQCLQSPTSYWMWRSICQPEEAILVVAWLWLTYQFLATIVVGKLIGNWGPWSSWNSFVHPMLHLVLLVLLYFLIFWHIADPGMEVVELWEWRGQLNWEMWKWAPS